MSLSDRDCAELLAFVAPRLRLRAAGFARVRHQVRKRIARRIAELGLAGAAAYRARLAADPGEWTALDALCRVTISRFYRDAPAFAALERALPSLAADALRLTSPSRVRAWSMACASGEEPYSLALLWRARIAPACPQVSLDLEATDASPHLIERARRATYPRSIFRELPGDLRAIAGVGTGEVTTLPPALVAAVRFRAADVRDPWPGGPWDLVLCRNLIFTYFESSLQAELLARLEGAVRPGGLLMIGKRETLPENDRWEPQDRAANLFRRV